jgi:predicted Zn-dependent protease
MASNLYPDENVMVSKMIPRWHHPHAVILIMLALVATAFYSLLSAPACIQAAALKELADQQRKRNDVTGAELNYRAALKLKPEANHVKISLAVLLFKQHREATAAEALALLANATLTTEEKVEVINAMPAQYRDRFLGEHVR